MTANNPNADVEKAVERAELRGGPGDEWMRLDVGDWQCIEQALRDQEALLRAVLNDNHATGHTTPETLNRITVHLGAKHRDEIEAMARDAERWRRLMGWHDAPSGGKRATVVFWGDEPHEPSSALDLVSTMDAAMCSPNEDGK